MQVCGDRLLDPRQIQRSGQHLVLKFRPGVMLRIHSKLVCWQIFALLLQGISSSATLAKQLESPQEGTQQSVEPNEGETESTWTTQDEREQTTVGFPVNIVYSIKWAAFWLQYQRYQDKTALCRKIAKHSGEVLPWVALCLNAVSFMVFASKGRHMNTVHILLIALAVSDTFSLSSYYDVSVQKHWGWSAGIHSDAGCKFTRYVTFVARDISSFFILLFTINRFLFVKFPLKVRTLVTVKRTFLAIAVSIVAGLAMEAYNLKYTTLTKSTLYPTLCRVFPGHVQEQSFYKLVLHYGVGFLLPSFIVAGFNVLIIYHLKLSSKQRSAMTNAKSDDKSSGNNHNKSLTIQLVTVSTFSLLVSLPNAVSAFFRHLQPVDPNTDEAILAMNMDSISDSLALLNYSCNLFLYCLTGSKFREDLKLLLLKVIKGECQTIRVLGFVTCRFHWQYVCETATTHNTKFNKRKTLYNINCIITLFNDSILINMK